MANNVLQFPGTAGNSYDLYISSGATLWNGTAFVTPTAGNWTTCALAMTDANSVGIFAYTMPASIAAGPSYGFTVRQRAGGTAAPTDPVVGSIAYSWDGTDLGAVTVGASQTFSTTGSVGSVTDGVPANVIHSGTARGGTANTITLATTASSVDNTYQMNQVYLSGGTGAGQTAVILYGGYVGSTRVATITTDWATIPDATTTYQIIPQGGVMVAGIGGTARPVTQDYLGTGKLTAEDAAGNPLAGVTVNAYLTSAYNVSGSTATVEATTTTDSLGHWSLSLRPSAYTLTFTFAGETSERTLIVT